MSTENDLVNAFWKNNDDLSITVLNDSGIMMQTAANAIPALVDNPIKLSAFNTGD